MQGDSAIIEMLNDVLTAELTAVNQYFAHAKMCANWGYDRLASKIREESIDEMKDAEAIIHRILYLDGVPNLQRLKSVRVGENVPEQFSLDLDLEKLKNVEYLKYAENDFTEQNGYLALDVALMDSEIIPGMEAADLKVVPGAEVVDTTVVADATSAG